MRNTLRVGEWVEVRSKEEILKSLDRQGRLDGLPFMPEMLTFCGKRFRVHKRAHKTCDPANGNGARGMDGAVHLQGLRCDGSSHDGCQAGCLIYWKETWLKRVTDPGPPSPPHPSGGCSEDDVRAATIVPGPDAAEPTYVCQATQVHEATRALRWWDPRHYVQDVRSGNVRVSQVVSALVFWMYHSVAEAGLGIGAALRWLYDRFQALRGGPPYPLRPGTVPSGEKTPTGRLDLQPGELVRVKSYPAILATLDDEWKNRGLYFDPEMVPHCRGSFRVLRRVERIIHEKTGKMVRFKSDAIILDGVECDARYAKYRKFCSRGYYQYCREIWLERAGA